MNKKNKIELEERIRSITRESNPESFRLFRNLVLECRKDPEEVMTNIKKTLDEEGYDPKNSDPGYLDHKIFVGGGYGVMDFLKEVLSSLSDKKEAIRLYHFGCDHFGKLYVGSFAKEIGEFEEAMRIYDECKFYYMAARICDEELNDQKRALEFYDKEFQTDMRIPVIKGIDGIISIVKESDDCLRMSRGEKTIDDHLELSEEEKEIFKKELDEATGDYVEHTLKRLCIDNKEGLSINNIYIMITLDETRTRRNSHFAKKLRYALGKTYEHMGKYDIAGLYMEDTENFNEAERLYRLVIEKFNKSGDSIKEGFYSRRLKKIENKK